MRITTSIIFLFLGTSLLGQSFPNEDNKRHNSSIIAPVIGMQYDFLSYKNYNDFILLNHYSIAGGIQLYEKLNIVANIGYMHTQHLIDGQNEKISAVPLLMSLQYRFFKDSWFSPSVRFDAGGIVYSNVKNKYVNSRLEIEAGSDNWNNDIFSNWGAYLSPQFLLSFKVKDLYIDLGAGYSMLNYSTLQPVDYDISEKIKVSGIQLKAGISYRFSK